MRDGDFEPGLVGKVLGFDARWQPGVELETSGYIQKFFGYDARAAQAYFVGVG